MSVRLPAVALVGLLFVLPLPSFAQTVAFIDGSGAPASSQPALEHLLADPSPLVRGAAVWALSRLAPQQVAQRQHATREEDAGVHAEWRDAQQTAQGRDNGR